MSARRGADILNTTPQRLEPIDALSRDLIAHDSAVAILLTTVRVHTWLGAKPLTSASGFFFRRGASLYLVTNRHVFADVPSNHFPDRVDIELHTDARDLTRYAVFTIPLYGSGLGLWRQATDSAGSVDVAAIELDVSRMPQNCVLQTFNAGHLNPGSEIVTVGDALTVIGFPLGFHDTIHHLAVARSASIASAYGVRFQQQGYFLTDARTHRGSSGSPVLRRRTNTQFADSSPLSWQLLGIHSTRIGMRPRDLQDDESLGLNCAWYADVLTTITQ
jgi:hypothetical protein